MPLNDMLTQARKLFHKSEKSAFAQNYNRLFNIQEIASDISLKWFMGAILLGFLATYNAWVESPRTTVEAVTNGTYVCWPFFQNCHKWIFLSALPQGYSQNIFFMGLFGLMVLAVYLMHKQRWGLAHACILVLFIARLYLSSINYSAKGNFDYYHTVFTLIFVLLPHKRFFAQLSIVLFYFMSTAAKIHPSWTLGAYFTSMKLGLPLFPIGTEPFFTHLVIIMEMVGAWFLFSHNKLFQRSALAFFIIFHLYSGLLVSYRYPTTVLPPLIILFGPWFTPYKQIPLNLKAIPGWLIMTTLLVFQMLPKLIPGDEKSTMEGNFYGLYMFEANHQCIVKVGYQDHTLKRYRTDSARFRCDSYQYWFEAKNQYCKFNQPINLTIDHSINGGPFYRIVDEPNICKLTYKAFGRNEWIKTPSQAKPIGRPVQNWYY